MKIALVIGAFSYGGAERVMCALANHLTLQHEVVLITVTEAEKTYFVDDKVRCVNGLGRRNDVDGILKLRKVFKKERPDVVVSFITHINIAAIVAAMGLKIPVIVSERNDPSKSAVSSFRKLLRRVIYPFAKGFVFQTEDAKNYFSKRIQKNSRIIPNPLFLTENSLPFDERRNEIVSVGRYVPQKRQELIIKAFANVARDSGYTLTVYGNGDEKPKLQQLVDSIEISDKVTLSDAVNDLHSRIKNAKIFILMSEYEGMPNALMEALGLGLACISTDCPCGGPKYLIDDGENGFLVEVNSQEQLEGRLKELISSPELQRRLSEKAVDVRNRLSHERVFSMWDEYIELISGKK